MPAHNEEDVIEESVRNCLGAMEKAGIRGEVIVADDGSRDRTGEILERLAAIHGNVKVVRLRTNSGYGVAMRNALKESRGEWVATIDSDGQFDPADAVRLLGAARGKYDCVTGCRAKKKDSLMRVLGNHVFNILVRLACRVSYRDAQCAVKVVKGDLLRATNLESKGYTLPTEIVFKMHYAGHKVGEMEVSHFPRKGGQSSLKFMKTSLDMFLFLIYIRMRLFVFRRRLIESL